MARKGMLPTPTARDWKSGSVSDATMERNARPLGEWAAMGMLGGHASSDGGPLNPSFVEWMMGFPVDWSIPKRDSELWEMPLFRSVQKS